jgi:hypothetical protein
MLLLRAVVLNNLRERLVAAEPIAQDKNEQPG